LKVSSSFSLVTSTAEGVVLLEEVLEHHQHRVGVAGAAVSRSITAWSVEEPVM
jgi:hypothetical protein